MSSQPPVEKKLKVVAQTQLEELCSRATTNARKRQNLNLHPTLDDSVQRFFNAMQPGTYVCPHRHSQADKWELFLILRGEAIVVIFDDNGKIEGRHRLNPDDDIVALEIPENTWHTLVIIKADTVLYESKRGPYSPLSDKDMAKWAPAEGSEACSRFLEWFLNGTPGSHPPELN